MPFGPLAFLLALAVGIVLGLLGGGGSILALPIFLYVFRVPTEPAITMSLAVVGISAFVGFLTHWRQRTVDLGVAIPFGLFGMAGAFITARVTHLVPESIRLALFTIFAFTAAVAMLRDSLRAQPVDVAREESRRRGRFSALLGVQAVLVGALTSLIGAGGGFVIVPALVLLARVPVKPAVGSSLLIITLNAVSGFLGHLGTVTVDWPLVGSFSVVAGAGAIAGSMVQRRVPQARIKQGFAVLILTLGTYLVLREL
jgi:uncharacterized protein